MTVERLRELLADFAPYDEVEVIVDPTRDTEVAGAYTVYRVAHSGKGARCKLIADLA